MRSCMICETPYSVLNSINYVCHNKPEHGWFDIYIGDHFKNSQRIAGRLKEYGLFDHVWTYRKTPEHVSFWEDIERRISPRKYLADVIIDEDYMFTAYDEVYLTSATRFPTCMVLSCPEAKVYFIEDGLCSYFDGIYVEPLSKLERLFYTFTGRDYKRTFPKIVYLNNARLCMHDVGYEVRQLHEFGQDEPYFQELLYHIFDYSSAGQHSARRIIYLAQSLEADLKIPGISEAEERVEEALSLFKNDVLYRPHPRNPVGEKKGLCIDRICDMWELVCMNEISDDTILIGSFSAALFTPKIIHDKEPWIIFTYGIYRDYLKSKGDSLVGGIEFMIRRIMQTYRNPDKVICVEKSEEIEKCIRRILESKTEKI